jgi:hypothetical protein
MSEVFRPHAESLIDARLRAARNAVAPRLPELAPQLAENKFAIYGALAGELREHDIELGRVDGYRRRRIEQHTIAMHLIGEHKH